MQYDILITREGTPVMSGGDIVQASADRAIYQRVYRALMNMPPSVASGVSMDHPEMIESAVKQYLLSAMRGDEDIDPARMEVIVDPGFKEQGAKITLRYVGTTSGGAPVSIETGTDFTMAAGALTTVNFEPDSLEALSLPRAVSVVHNVTLDDFASEVIIPIRPYPKNSTMGDRESRDTIYLFASDQALSTDGTDYAVSVLTYDRRMIYPISRYIDDFVARRMAVTAFVLDTAITGVSVAMVDGELCIVLAVPMPDVTITGTATVVNAAQVSTTFSVIEPLARKPVFSLRPVRGKYVAVFPRSVAPGDYVVQYTGVVEVS